MKHSLKRQISKTTIKSKKYLKQFQRTVKQSVKLIERRNNDEQE
ncbi:hypothetical protein [Macrococcoides canis]|nr:hypothetical protein [Macrococcus canis]